MWYKIPILGTDVHVDLTCDTEMYPHSVKNI